MKQKESETATHGAFREKGIYFRWFTIANAGFLAVLMAVYFLVFYSI